MISFNVNKNRSNNVPTNQPMHISSISSIIPPALPIKSNNIQSAANISNSNISNILNKTINNYEIVDYDHQSSSSAGSCNSKPFNSPMNPFNHQNERNENNLSN